MKPLPTLFSISPQQAKNQLITFFKKAPWAIGCDAFAWILLLLLLSVLIGEFLFYEYAVVPDLQKPDIVDISVKFHENMYNKVLKSWEEQAIK